MAIGQGRAAENGTERLFRVAGFYSIIIQTSYSSARALIQLGFAGWHDKCFDDFDTADLDVKAMTTFSPRTPALLGACLLILMAGRAEADAFNITYEPAGQESANTTALCSALGSGNCTVGTENFNEQSTGSGKSFTTDYGTGGTITGTYVNAQINTADQYGGAGGTGNYAVTFASNGGYQVNLSTTLSTGVNYFGFWLSALDAGNEVSFYKNGVDVYDFTPQQVIAALGSCYGSTPNPYCGNPNSAFSGQDSGEQFVFVNFYDLAGSFDSIHFSEGAAGYGGGYESDNHTVGYVTAETGIQVPEPASIVLFAGGVAGLLALRRRFAI